MADCPLCDDWHYDPAGAAVCAWTAGNPVTPVVWDGERLRLARGDEVPGGPLPAIGAHICYDHPDSDLAKSVGPVQPWQPAVIDGPAVDWYWRSPGRPWWKRLLRA